MTPKHPGDPNQLAKSIVDIATEQRPATILPPPSALISRRSSDDSKKKEAAN
jgi:hypothetical protein